ncbi:MAG: FadR family transcriptional regulator [Clostridia bacterium]|nr:FadR family transcriptional regulator [Clostridia bacterium]
MAARDQKLYLQVMRQIHELVLDRQLKPGDLLPPEQTLAADFHVSRNVVREAIKSMEVMGIVRAVAGRGTELLPFRMDYFLQGMLFFRVPGNERAVRQMFDVRKNLELSYMRQAFYALTREDILHLREVVDRIRVSYEEEGLFADLDREFHLSLFRPLKNEVLDSLMNAIWEVDVRFQLEQKRPHLAGSVAKHEAIVKALEEYDFIAFAKAMEYHFSSGKYTRDDSYMEETE